MTHGDGFAHDALTCTPDDIPDVCLHGAFAFRSQSNKAQRALLWLIPLIRPVVFKELTEQSGRHRLHASRQSPVGNDPDQSGRFATKPRGHEEQCQQIRDI